MIEEYVCIKYHHWDGNKYEFLPNLIYQFYVKDDKNKRNIFL